MLALAGTAVATLCPDPEKREEKNVESTAELRASVSLALGRENPKGQPRSYCGVSELGLCLSVVVRVCCGVGLHCVVQ